MTEQEKDNKWSEMYQIGYDNAIHFGYIPEFKTEKEKQDFARGYRDGKNQNSL